jgi:hypothetical protein
MKRILRNGIFGLLMSLLSVALVLAQANCPDLVTEALETVDASCAATGRNEACYGYDQVEASFLTSVADDFFTSPADLAAVAEIETIRTAPLNTEAGTWGVAVMNLQADLPSTIPGQTVTFVLLGDVELENAVAPEEAFVPSEGIEVTVDSAAGANVRSGPSQNFNVVGGLRDGEIVMADGLSEDGTWLRVAYRERPAWISMTVIDDNNPALRELPTLTADLRTPMQAFYLRTGIGQPECAEAPSDSLLVQGPENIEITIDVNGAAIQLGSTGILNIVYDENGNPFLNVSVFDGTFKIGDVEIRRGQHSLICLGDENSRGLDGENNDLVVTCDPTPPEAFEEDWCNLENLPAEILNYELDVPCPGETPPPTGGGGGGATDSQIAGVNCNNFGLVSPLFPVDAGTHTFEWTAVTGDNITYQLVFYNYEGTEVESFYTPNTSYSVNLGAETSTGGTFFWEVRAYQNGAYACVTFRSPALTRTADADVAGTGSFSVNIICTFDSSTDTYSASVSWSGLPAGDTLTAVLNSPPYGNPSSNSSNPSGTINLSIMSFASASVTVTTSGGFSQTKPC